MSFSLALSSCQYILPKSVVDASLNEKGELILTYSDKSTQNVGVVKGEDGKDGVDGKDGQDGKDGLNGQNGKDGVNGKDGQDGKDGVGGQNSACEHQFSKWETQIEATCTSIGYKTRTCSNCGAMEYRFQNATGHYYDNPVEILSIPCEQRLVNKTCTHCGDTKIEETYVKHLYDENGVCTKCGDETDFIESEEYIEDIIIPPQTIHFGQSVPGIIWWNKDKTYGLKISLGNPSYLFLLGYVGTPVHVRLPAYYNEAPLGTIGFSADEPEIFRNCTTLKSIYIPDTVTRIDDYAFDGCTNLETVRFSENLKQIGAGAFRNCTSLKTLDFKNNNCSISSHSDIAFQNCTSLTEIYTPLLYIMAVSDDDFFTCTALKKIYVPVEHYDTYLKRFKDFPSNLEIIIYE